MDALRLAQRSVHLDDLARTGAGMEIVHVLGHDCAHETGGLEPRECVVPVVRLGAREDVEAQRVELHTRSGSRRNASMCATSNGSYCAQIPSRERKSGIPDSVEIPAPVRMRQGFL